MNFKQPRGSTIGITKTGATVQQKFDSLDQSIVNITNIINSINSAGGGENVGTPWLYTATSAVNSFVVGFVGTITSIPCIYINGGRQEPTVNFTYNATNKTISLVGFSLEINDQVTVIILDGTSPTLTKLAANTGAALVGTSKGISVQESFNQLFPVSIISDLKNITPPVGEVTLRTKGAFAVGDEGAGEWIFSKTNRASDVATYPRLFVAPNTDPTGAAGAWRLNYGEEFHAIQWGLGCTTDPLINKEILEQLVKINNARRKIILPAKTIFCNSLLFTINPMLEGTKNAIVNNNGTAGLGTTFITQDSYSSDDFLKVTSTSDTNVNRVTGCYIKGVTIVGKDFYSGTGGANSGEFGTRTQRTAMSLNYIGGMVKIEDIFVIGFKRAFVGNEVWDGSIYDFRAMYCSSSNGTGVEPAVYLGTTVNPATRDNSNNLTITHMHIEFCPFGLQLGFCEHVEFDGLKVECHRKTDATHPVVQILPDSTKVSFMNSLFVTHPDTLDFYMRDSGRYTSFNTCWFAGGEPGSNYPYMGVRWYDGSTTSTLYTKTLQNCSFDNCLTSSSNFTGDDYPIRLGDYTVFSGRANTNRSATTSSGATVNNNSGFLSLGYSSVVDNFFVHLGDSGVPCTAGAAVFFRNTKSDVRSIRIKEGSVPPFKWVGGTEGGSSTLNDNKVGLIGTPWINAGASTSSIDIYGKSCIFIMAATTITDLNGMGGQVITVFPRVAGCIIKNDPAKIVTKTGADLTMTANTAYQFVCTGGTRVYQV